MAVVLAVVLAVALRSPLNIACQLRLPVSYSLRFASLCWLSTSGIAVEGLPLVLAPVNRVVICGSE